MAVETTAAEVEVKQDTDCGDDDYGALRKEPNVNRDPKERKRHRGRGWREGSIVVYSHETSNDRKGHVRRRGRLLAGISVRIIDAVFSRKKRATEVPQHRPERGVLHYGMVWRGGRGRAPSDKSVGLFCRPRACPTAWYQSEGRPLLVLEAIVMGWISDDGLGEEGKCELRLWDGFAPGKLRDVHADPKCLAGVA